MYTFSVSVSSGFVSLQDAALVSSETLNATLSRSSTLFVSQSRIATVLQALLYQAPSRWTGTDTMLLTLSDGTDAVSLSLTYVTMSMTMAVSDAMPMTFAGSWSRPATSLRCSSSRPK